MSGLAPAVSAQAACQKLDVVFCCDALCKLSAALSRLPAVQSRRSNLEAVKQAETQVPPAFGCLTSLFPMIIITNVSKQHKENAALPWGRFSTTRLGCARASCWPKTRFSKLPPPSKQMNFETTRGWPGETLNEDPPVRRAKKYYI